MKTQVYIAIAFISCTILTSCSNKDALFEKALYDKDYHISMTMITTSTQPLDGRSWSMLNEFNKELDTTYDCRITARYLDLESIKTFYQYTEDSDSFERLLETELQ